MLAELIAWKRMVALLWGSASFMFRLDSMEEKSMIAKAGKYEGLLQDYL
jgi:hypothetical protein